MPVTPATYANILARINSLIFNPSQNFLTAADYQTYIDTAAMTTATELGGLRFIDTSILTVAKQRDYPIDTGWKRLDAAQYIQNIGASNELVFPMDVITEKDADFLALISQPVMGYNADDLTITGQPQPTSKFAIFWPQNQTLRLSDPPATGGDTIKLWVLGVPQTMNVGVTYAGDAIDLQAIVYAVCDLARLKSRETQESGVWHQRWQEECDRIRRFRSKMNRTRQIADGRFRVTKLRSVNGSR